MFDIAWSELLLIGAVALIFIGPKELPGLLVNIGRWVRRARSMASEFQSSLDQAVREAEVDQLKQKMNAAVMEAEKDLPSIDLPSFSMQLDPAPVAAALPDPVPAMIEAVPPAPEDTVSAPAPEGASAIAPAPEGASAITTVPEGASAPNTAPETLPRV
jgi:sec-independent protein translocase protein TatB